MFRTSQPSKVAVFLIEHLRARQFTLFDIQNADADHRTSLAPGRSRAMNTRRLEEGG